MKRFLRWLRDVIHDRLDEGTIFYGEDRTVHDSTHLDVHVHEGRVVAVWFRCALLSFEQHDVDAAYASMYAGSPVHAMTAVEIAPASDKE